MSTARMGTPAPRRSDPSRTREAKAATLARRQARTLKGWTPAPFDADTLAAEIGSPAVSVAR